MIKRIRARKLSLNAKIFNKARGETEAAVVSRVLQEVKKFDFYNLKNLITTVAEHSSLPKGLTPIYGPARECYEIFDTGTHLSRKNYIYWIIGIFKSHHKILRRFNELREIVNSRILKGDSHQAIKVLAEIDELSKSWWSVDTGIHIKKELLQTDTKDHINGLKDLYPNANISGTILDLLLLSESGSVYLFIDTILGRMKEYKGSNIDEAIENGAAQSCLLLPIYHDPSRKPNFSAMHDFRHESIIDQYVLFKATAIEMHLQGNLKDDNLNSTILEIARLVQDQELLNILEPKDKIDPFVKKIVDAYTQGEYEQVIDEISRAVTAESTKIFGLIEIYARSKIYASSACNEDTFFDSVANAFSCILNLDPSSHEQKEYLHRISVKFRNEAWAKSLMFHLLSLLDQVEDEHTIELSRQHTTCLGDINTPKASVRDYRLQFTGDSTPSTIPKQRILKYSQEKIKIKSIEKALFPIYSDFLKVQSQLYMERGEITEAINFSINEYLNNNGAFNYLPISKLCSAAINIPKTDTSTFISCLIIYDIYGREKCSAFDETKAELFEEFLYANGTHLPSNIFTTATLDPRTVYFLKNICIPAQLDNIIEYESNDEVVHERVAIIDILISGKADGHDELRAEKDNVLEALLSEKLRAKIESGKLFVDVQALEAHRKHIYAALYEKAKTLKGGINLDPISYQNDSIHSKDIFEIKGKQGVAIAASDKSEILYKIFTQATYDFALNENYGLDKYLSAEIRHIVFSTQLRSCFEKSNLITTQKNGSYLPNDHWRSKYHFVNSSIIDEIDDSLKRFSKKSIAS